MTLGSNNRRAGTLVPLFSMASARSWGIGEIGDLELMTAWLSSAGQRLLQLLPITETSPDDPSPYGALSAMAIDPQYISLADMEDFAAIGGEERLDDGLRAALDRVRSSAAIDYRAVRELKQIALRRSFDHFLTTEWTSDSARATALRAFATENAWWLDDYVLFRALHARYEERAWTEWPQELRKRAPNAIENERRALANETLFRTYVQWIAGEQWHRARRRSNGVALFGDLPFMVNGDSADVWSRQDEFDQDGSVGVPPDAFSATGQDWGLPAYRWDVLRERDFDWLRVRARRMAQLFDGYRVDHLVGFYRTFVRPRGSDHGAFTPGDERSQIALGEDVLSIFRSTEVEIVAEDLGTVPDFVRESLARARIPGYKVFRWERHWHTPGQPFRDPLEYPAASVATSGTHDTEPMTVWWAQAPVEERRAVLDTPPIHSRLSEPERTQALASSSLTETVRKALLEVLFASGANLLVLPIQDVFGWSDRINQPATVGDQNWTWRLPWPADRMSREPEAIAVAEQLRTWSATYGR
jgi:4-alpha-glucanotransferase